MQILLIMRFKHANGRNFVLHYEFEDDVIVILEEFSYINRFSHRPGF
jgi:hypothetical protein